MKGDLLKPLVAVDEFRYVHGHGVVEARDHALVDRDPDERCNERLCYRERSLQVLSIRTVEVSLVDELCSLDDKERRRVRGLKLRFERSSENGVRRFMNFFTI